MTMNGCPAVDCLYRLAPTFRRSKSAHTMRIAAGLDGSSLPDPADTAHFSTTQDQLHRIAGTCYPYSSDLESSFLFPGLKQST
jgi:hypothetical protein